MSNNTYEQKQESLYDLVNRKSVQFGEWFEAVSLPVKILVVSPLVVAYSAVTLNNFTTITCSDPQVKTELKKLLEQRYPKVEDIYGVSTIKEEKKHCQCFALAKVKDHSGTEKNIDVEWDITKADDGISYILNVKKYQ